MVENIAYEHGLCSCDEMYTRRGLTAPDCPWHAYSVEEAMKAFAQAVAEDALKRAAENAKILVSNGETHLDVKSYTLDNGIRFSPDYNRILSTPINTEI